MQTEVDSITFKGEMLNFVPFFPFLLSDAQGYLICSLKIGTAVFDEVRDIELPI